MAASDHQGRRFRGGNGSAGDALVLNGAFYSLDLAELIAWLEGQSESGLGGMNTLGFRLLAAYFQKQRRHSSQWFRIEQPAMSSRMNS
jgi:hypothetical protein